MIEIKDLLNSFRDILNKGELKKASIALVLSDVLGVCINTKDVDIKNGVLYLNIKPIYKSEILLKKEKIISKLKSSLGERVPEKFL